MAWIENLYSASKLHDGGMEEVVARCAHPDLARAAVSFACLSDGLAGPDPGEFGEGYCLDQKHVLAFLRT
jgi:hypothetical protein